MVDKAIRAGFKKIRHAVDREEKRILKADKKRDKKCDKLEKM